MVYDVDQNTIILAYGDQMMEIPSAILPTLEYRLGSLSAAWTTIPEDIRCTGTVAHVEPVVGTVWHRHKHDPPASLQWLEDRRRRDHTNAEGLRTMTKRQKAEIIKLRNRLIIDLRLFASDCPEWGDSARRVAKRISDHILHLDCADDDYKGIIGTMKLDQATLKALHREYLFGSG